MLCSQAIKLHTFIFAWLQHLTPVIHNSVNAYDTDWSHLWLHQVPDSLPFVTSNPASCYFCGPQMNTSHPPSLQKLCVKFPPHLPSPSSHIQRCYDSSPSQQLISLPRPDCWGWSSAIENLRGKWKDDISMERHNTLGDISTGLVLGTRQKIYFSHVADKDCWWIRLLVRYQQWTLPCWRHVHLAVKGIPANTKPTAQITSVVCKEAHLETVAKTCSQIHWFPDKRRKAASADVTAAKTDTGRSVYWKKKKKKKNKLFLLQPSLAGKQNVPMQVKNKTKDAEESIP